MTEIKCSPEPRESVQDSMVQIKGTLLHHLNFQITLAEPITSLRCFETFETDHGLCNSLLVKHIKSCCVSEDTEFNQFLAIDIFGMFLFKENKVHFAQI